MNMNFTLLQDGAAGAASGAGAMGGSSFWIMMVLIFVVMYFFMIRPQQKRQKELKKFRESLQKGDRVVTVGGIYGVISEVKENHILVEVTDGVRLRFDKTSILQGAADLTQTK